MFRKFKIQKYNFDLSKIIGIEKQEEELKKYYLNVKSKVIRKYHGTLRKPKSPLCTYLNMDESISLRIRVKKNTLKQITDLDTFIKTKIYTDYNPDETQQYIYKYKIVDLGDDVSIEVVFLPLNGIENEFKDVVKKTSYIDYISFPAFSYEFLYKYNVLSPLKDIFVVLLWDKTYITAYKYGVYIRNEMINYGLKNIYNKIIEKFDIEDFDKEAFFKLLQIKGLKKENYTKKEEPLYYFLLTEIKQKFFKFISDELEIISNEIDTEENNFNRIFVTTINGNINGIEQVIKNVFEKDGIDGRSFDFYEKYNLDKLPISPFLFLAMLETYYSYKTASVEKLNFSLWKRPPNFIFRTTGMFVTALVSGLLVGVLGYGVTQGITWVESLKLKSLENSLLKLKTKDLALYQEKQNLLTLLNKQKIKKNKKIQLVENLLNSIKEVSRYKSNPSFYKTVELKQIILGLINNGVRIKKINVLGKDFILELYAPKEENILNFLKFLKNNKWKFKNKMISFVKDKKYYVTTINVSKE